MADMDTTRIEELLTQLATADPAEAPDLADELTATLADALDQAGPSEPEAEEPPATTEADGGTP